MDPNLKWEEMSAEELRTKPVGSRFFFDIETFPNYLLIAFKCEDSDKVLALESSQGRTFDRSILYLITSGFELIGFNSARFDVPLLALAMQGETVQAINAAAQRIISENMQPWQVARELGAEIPAVLRHIDLFDVVPLSKSHGSLKQRAAQMMLPTIRELPHPPGKTVDDWETAEQIRAYCCGGDLEYTAELWRNLKEQIELRRTLSRDYGIDLMSKSDAQIAEAVISHEVGRKTGARIPRPRNLAGSSVRFVAPPSIRAFGFRTPLLASILDRLEAHDFIVGEKGTVGLPEWLPSVEIGRGTYTMGIGGLHSTESEVSYKSSPSGRLIDRDVASYYPALIITQQLAPETIGKHFGPVYRKIRDDRLVAKSNGLKAKANSLKIVVNGGFGKLHSPYSVLYSPRCFLQVTLTGQLAILMLIDELEASGIRVISANTDGVVSYPRDDQIDLFHSIIRRWETVTGFETEETRYAAYYARDVNSYVAIKEDGKIKGKGAYANPWSASGEDPIFRFHKNPSMLIVIDAVRAFFAHRKPVEQTIRECRDPSQFLVVRKVEGGGEKNGRFVGKICRWYYSINSPGPIRYVKSGNAVADSEGACPAMTIPETIPEDLDWDRYVDEARAMIAATGFSFCRQGSLY